MIKQNVADTKLTTRKSYNRLLFSKMNPVRIIVRQNTTQDGTVYTKLHVSREVLLPQSDLQPSSTVLRKVMHSFVQYKGPKDAVH